MRDPSFLHKLSSPLSALHCCLENTVINIHKMNHQALLEFLTKAKSEPENSQNLEE